MEPWEEGIVMVCLNSDILFWFSFILILFLFLDNEKAHDHGHMMWCHKSETMISKI